MNAHFPPAIQPRTPDGRSYEPVADYGWLTKESRADLAEQLDCTPAEIEYRLDTRLRMDAHAIERRDREDPYGYTRRRW